MAGEAGLHLEDAVAGGAQLLGDRDVGVDVGIGDRETERDFGAIGAAEQVVDGRLERLALDVEERHFHRRLGFRGMDHGLVGAIQQPLDSERIGTDQERPQMHVERPDTGLGGTGEDGPGRRLAPSRDAGVGVDLDDDDADLVRDVARTLAADGLHGDADGENRKACDGDSAHGVLLSLC